MQAVTKYDEELKSLLHEAWNTGLGEALGESTSQGLSFAQWYANNMPARVDRPTPSYEAVGTRTISTDGQDSDEPEEHRLHRQIYMLRALLAAAGVDEDLLTAGVGSSPVCARCKPVHPLEGDDLSLRQKQIIGSVEASRGLVEDYTDTELNIFAPATNYSGVGADDRGIFLHPAAWNCERLPGRDEGLLAYFFKLVYMERVAQGKRGLRSRLDDSEWLSIFREVPKALTALVAGLREGRLTDEVLEPAQVQIAASLAAWHADMCQRVWEAEDTETGGGS